MYRLEAVGVYQTINTREADDDLRPLIYLMQVVVVRPRPKEAGSHDRAK